MDIYGFDHVDLVVKDKDSSIEFYSKILGFKVYSYSEEDKKALIFGNNKINLISVEDLRKDKKPKPENPTPGSSSLCFMTNKPLKEIMSFLKEKNINLISGPQRHTGATNLMISIYIKDPDGNLVQIGNNVT